MASLPPSLSIFICFSIHRQLVPSDLGPRAGLGCVKQTNKQTGTQTKPTNCYSSSYFLSSASFVIQIPTAFVPAISPKTGCNEFGQSWGEELFFTYATVTLYIIPLGIIIPCYTSIAINMSKSSTIKKEDAKHLARRKKTIKWVFIVVIFYALMWLPCHVVHMWMAFDPHVTAETPLYIELHTAANVLMFVNSSVNPYLYTLAGSSFRKHVKDVAYCCCGGVLRNKPKECLSRSETVSTWM